MSFKPWRVKWKGVFSKPSRKWIVAINFCLLSFGYLIILVNWTKLTLFLYPQNFASILYKKLVFQKISECWNIDIFWKIADSNPLNSIDLRIEHDPLHSGRRVLQNRISILLFFGLKTQFSMYKNTLDISKVLPSC